MEVTKKLWAEGGVPRFYRGLAPGLIQASGPVVPRNRSQLSAAMFSFSKSHQCGQCVASNYARTMPCRVLAKSSLDTPLTLPESPPGTQFLSSPFCRRLSRASETRPPTMAHWQHWSTRVCQQRWGTSAVASNGWF